MTKAKQAGKGRALPAVKSLPAKATASAPAAEEAPRPRKQLMNQLGVQHVPADMPVHEGPVITEAGTDHAAGEMITVTVPKAFKLTLDDHTPVEIAAGVQEMAAEHANHWWSKVQGVKVYKGRPGK